MNINVRFYGVFKSAANVSELKVDLENGPATVRALVDALRSRVELSNLNRLLLDDNLDPRPNALIMVSGKEISTLRSLDTALAEDDEVAFLPIAHGG